MKLELLLAVVHNDKAAYYSSLIQSHQANLQLTVPAKGTSHLILNYLGLTENPKSLSMRLAASSTCWTRPSRRERTTRASPSPSR